MADPSDPYNTQHSHVLDSLSVVKSIVLLVDINPSASNSLILQIFSSCFDVVSGSSKASSGEEIGKNVEFHMTELLATLVDEAQILPDQVVDIILAQFLRADPRALQASTGKGKKGEPVDHKQSTLLMKQAPPAYNMAMNICNLHPDKMGRYITQHFSSMIMHASGLGGAFSAKSKSKAKARDVEDADEEEASGPSESELRELQKAHVLARELWRATPDVLQNIVPQIEAELAAENEDIRLLATDTMGGMIAGIGAAGLPPPPPLDPTAYPSQSVSVSRNPTEYNFLTTPKSPHAFSAVHPTPYQTFLGRRNDKSSRIRATWATAVGRIIMTAAGNVGLDIAEETNLLKYLAAMLMDGEEKVRLAAIEVIGQFSFLDFIDKLGKAGGVAETGSVLCNLSERMKDPKHSVRTEAMTLLGKIWGIASGAIAQGNESAHELFAPIPSKIFDTVYINDSGINMLVDKVLYESLFPLQYPAQKSKQTNGVSQKSRPHVNGDDHSSGHQDELFDADKIRVERMLLLVKDLEPKAKRVFFAFQARQIQNAKVMSAFLKQCEDYNGGVMDKNEADTKKKLNGLIEWNIKPFPDLAKANEDLQKFAKWHDRRSYALIRFCMAVESDYRKVQKAIKELTKRIEESPGSGASVHDTIIHLVWRAGIIFYNISHVPAIMEYARTNEKELGSTAHEVLKDISTQNPDIFKTHVKELCEDLVRQAPSADQSNNPSAVDTLKACAGFARKFPQEIPDDRKFLQSMINFAIYGTPPKAAKYAISVLMASRKKEMHAKDLASQCIKAFEYGAPHFVSNLAMLSQLMLLAPNDIEDEIDTIVDIANNQVLAHQSSDSICSETEWHTNPDSHLQAKTWALKILANRLRSLSPTMTDINHIAAPIYKLLNSLVANSGQLSPSDPDPSSHLPALRLHAARLLLKLSRHSKSLDRLLQPSAFNTLATVAQDPSPHVRSGFVRTLMQYLSAASKARLSTRFYVPLFLLAFEPNETLRGEAQTWLRARAGALRRSGSGNSAGTRTGEVVVMEGVLARLLSCLAWHPDFEHEDSEEVLAFVRYLMFYLQCVVDRENVAVVFHVAQRVKGVQDAVADSTDTEGRARADEQLYVMAELAQEVTRQFAEEKGWSLQAWPGKLGLPNDIFARIQGHERAQEVATKQFLPDGVTERLEGMVRAELKGRKRKSDHGDVEGKRKKVKVEKEKGERIKVEKRAKAIKTPKKRKSTESEDVVPDSERRRSGRTKGMTSYVEQDDSEDERDMERWNQRDEEEDENEAGGEDDDEDENEEVEDVRDDTSANGVVEDKPSDDEDVKMSNAEPVIKRELRSRGKAKTNSRVANSTAKRASNRGIARKKNETPVPISSDKESDDDLSDAPESESDG